jgi:hypothetical protein
MSSIFIQKVGKKDDNTNARPLNAHVIKHLVRNKLINLGERASVDIKQFTRMGDNI